MKTYQVYFEMFGKKMKAEIKAKSEADAKQQVINKIIFHKVQAVPSDIDSIMEWFEKILK